MEAVYTVEREENQSSLLGNEEATLRKGDSSSPSGKVPSPTEGKRKHRTPLIENPTPSKTIHGGFVINTGSQFPTDSIKETNKIAVTEACVEVLSKAVLPKDIEPTDPDPVYTSDFESRGGS